MLPLAAESNTSIGIHASRYPAGTVRTNSNSNSSARANIFHNTNINTKDGNITHADIDTSIVIHTNTTHQTVSHTLMVTVVITQYQ